MSLLRNIGRSGLTTPLRRGFSTATKPVVAKSGLSAQACVAAWPNTRVSTLPNGLRVASETGLGHTATVGVWIDTGSRYEDAKSNGVAHFLEHMFFKGTASRSRTALETEVENIGGHLNAYTSRENTVIYAKVPEKHVPQAMDILADILQNSKFSTESIENERSVILREMEEVDGQLEEVIFDRLHETAYRNNSLGYTILGPVENIQSITREDIKRYVATHYTAPRMVVAGAGAVDHSQLVKLSEKLFANLPSQPPAGLAPHFKPALFTGSDIRVRQDDMHLHHIAYAFPTAGWKDADNFPLMVIQTLLGSFDNAASSTAGRNSRSPLVSQVAKKDLAKSFMTFNTQYSDTGLFGVHAVCDSPYGQMDLVRHIGSSFTDLCVELVHPGRLDEAKNQLKMNMLAHLDGSTQVCEDIGRQLLTYGRRMHPLEVIARIDAVDAEAVRAAANRFFWDRDIAFAGIGNLTEIPDYGTLRRYTYTNTI